MEEQSIKVTRTGARPAKKAKMNQIPIGILVIAGIIALGAYIAGVKESMVFYFVTGVSFGFVLQRSRFCFTAAFRDPNLTKSTSLTRAVLLAFALATIGITAIKYGAEGALDLVNVNPLSLATVLGAFLFGIGMVIAGGCASGTLMRVGEGFTMQLLSLFFFIIGSMIADAQLPFWTETFHNTGLKLFLPDILDMGYFWAAILQLAVIGVLYFIAERFEQKHIGGEAK